MYVLAQKKKNRGETGHQLGKSENRPSVVCPAV